MSTPQPEAPLEAIEGGSRLYLYVQPKASRTRLVGYYDSRLKLQVAAPPVDGRANAAVVTFLTRTLDLRKADVRLVAGLSAKRKTVEILGLSPAQIRQRLAM